MCPPVRAHWRHLANTIEHVLPSAHLSPQSKQKSIGSVVLHSSQQKVPILYNGRLFPPKLPLPIGDLEPHLTHDSLGVSKPTTHMAFRLVVFALTIAECPYTLQWDSPPPQHCPFHGGSGPSSNIWFPGPTQVLNPKSSRSVQLFLQGSLVWQTDRQTTLLGRSTVMRPNNNSTHLSIPPQTHNFRYTTKISTRIGHDDSSRQTRKHYCVVGREIHAF